jgi:hypothetical protein
LTLNNHFKYWLAQIAFFFANIGAYMQSQIIVLAFRFRVPFLTHIRAPAIPVHSPTLQRNEIST